MAGSISSRSALKSSGNPIGRGSRRGIVAAIAAVERSGSGTSAAVGSAALRIIWTKEACLLGQTPDRIHEREPEHMHREVDRAATALAGPGVIPLGSCRQDLEVTVRRVCVPAATARVLDGYEGQVRLEARGQARQSDPAR